MNFKITPPILHCGAWDGSAGVASGDGYFIGATDEKNTLRLYSTTGAVEGITLLELNDWPLFPKKLGSDGTFKEADIEGATAIGEVIFWITSHARDSEGKTREERQVFFATTFTGAGAASHLEPCGKPYCRLLDDILADPRLAFLRGPIRGKIPPKSKGGFNIESLCADGEQLSIGFRNPIIDGKAVIVPLTNPREVIGAGARAVLGSPVFLDLGGLGFRDMVKWQGEFLIVAGDYRDRFEDPEAHPPKLFKWSGNGSDAPIELKVDLLDLNPEAALVFGNKNDGEILILSDDGKWKVGLAEDRKKIEDSNRQFRSVWLVAE